MTHKIKILKRFIKRNKNSEKIILISFILIFIFVRSIYFTKYLNFSLDQATFSLKSLEIYTNKTLTLIGPSLSLNLNGRHIFQSSITYYFQLIFLMLGNFDPIYSSYIFMMFCSIMIIPLYFGVKLLINKNIAFTVIIIYTFLPYFIDYTRFLWSPNYQLSLIPGLLLFMGLFKAKQKTLYFFIISLFSALLIQIHYIFIAISLGILLYYLLTIKKKVLYLLIYFLGHLIGLTPIIFFEIRNHFYNLNTAVLFIKNYKQVLESNSGASSHYLLPFSLFAIIIFLSFVKNIINFKFNIIIALFLLTITLNLYSKKPENAYGMAQDWNYLNEKKVYDIIRAENLNSYNIANLVYDTKANVQVYLHAKNGVKIENENYETNKYLFVINNGDGYMNNGAYEVNRFKPSVEINKWPLNSIYTLYLLKRAI